MKRRYKIIKYGPLGKVGYTYKYREVPKSLVTVGADQTSSKRRKRRMSPAASRMLQSYRKSQRELRDGTSSRRATVAKAKRIAAKSAIATPSRQISIVTSRKPTAITSLKFNPAKYKRTVTYYPLTKEEITYIRASLRAKGDV